MLACQAPSVLCNSKNRKKALGRAPLLLWMAGNSVFLLLQAAVGSSHSVVCFCLTNSAPSSHGSSSPFHAFCHLIQMCSVLGPSLELLTDIPPGGPHQLVLYIHGLLHPGWIYSPPAVSTHVHESREWQSHCPSLKPPSSSDSSQETPVLKNYLHGFLHPLLGF